MRDWTRATNTTLCGLCRSRFIQTGEPMVVVTVPGVKVERYRCQACEGAAPPDLPPLVVRAPASPTPMAHLLTTPDALPFDYKTAAAGEREPGEDG